MPRILFHQGENVEPTGLDNDYMTCLPASRLRAIGMGRNLGTVPLIMCQADRHWDDNFSPFCVPQMVGWVLAHDCLPENSAFWDVLAVESRIGRDDVTFRPYWKEGLGLESRTEDVLVSAHTRPGHALLWILNTSRSSRQAEVRLDLDQLGLGRRNPARPLRAVDAETGEPVRFSTAGSGEGRLSIEVPARFWRAVRIVQPRELDSKETFLATFENTDARAEEAMGYAGPFGWTPLDGPAPQGRRGSGVSLQKPLSYLARHHVFCQQGRIEFQVNFDPAAARGTLAQVDQLTLRVDQGKLKLTSDKSTIAEADVTMTEGPAWYPVRMVWKAQQLSVHVGGRAVLEVGIPGGMPIKQQARGLDLCGGRKRAEPATVTFGPLANAVLDEVVMGAP